MVGKNYKMGVRKMKIKDGAGLSVEAGDIPQLPGITSMIAIRTDRKGNLDLDPGNIVIYKNAGVVEG